MPASPVPLRPPARGEAGGEGPPARLLAFDSATEHLSVVLCDGATDHTCDEPGGPRASAALLPTIQRLLDEAGLPMSALDAIGFGRGPGAFTGLRTACAVAQGLAFGLDRPVLALDTLAAVAEDARRRGGADDTWVAMDARMDEIYAARYRHGPDGWQSLTEPALYTLEALRAAWAAAPPRAVAGSAVAAFGERLPCEPGVPRDAQALPRAAALAAIGRAAWAAGRAQPADAALPLYLRDKVALTTEERDAVRAAKIGDRGALGAAKAVS